MFRVEVVASPAGEVSATVELDADGLLARRGLLQQAVLASAVPSRRVLPETEQPVREVGQVLFAGLLGTGEVARRYSAAVAVAAERGGAAGGAANRYPGAGRELAPAAALFRPWATRPGWRSCSTWPAVRPG